MSDDLVARLRISGLPDAKRAAKRIEALEARVIERHRRIEELEAALRELASPIHAIGSVYEAIAREANRRQKLARAVLDGTPGEQEL